MSENMMEKGIILYIGGFEMPDKNAAAHRVLSNAKIFRELGKRVVFIGVDKTLPADHDILKTKTTVQEFESYAVPYPVGSFNWIKYLTSIQDYVTIIKTLGNVEMVVFYNFQAIAMKRLMSYCKNKNIKCCADITEWRSANGERLIYRILKNSDTWYRMHILHKKLDCMIVISRYLQNYYKNCKNVVYIPVLVDCSEEKWQNNYNKSTDVLNLVYAGNPGRKDRIDILIEALACINRNYHLDVIGITEKQYLDNYQECKNILDSNRQCIEFHGRLSHIATLEYIKKANYSCFFRENDRVSQAGFPTKFAEAISCGTPVLTNKTSNIEEYIQDNKNGILLDELCEDIIASFINNAPYEMITEKMIFDYKSFFNQNYTDLIKLFNWRK